MCVAFISHGAYKNIPILFALVTSLMNPTELPAKLSYQLSDYRAGNIDLMFSNLTLSP